MDDESPMQAKTFTTLFFLFMLLPAFAQKEANVWYFSDYGLEFNSRPAKLIFDAAPHQSRGMAVICDSLGNLLFYSDGFNVWNRSHLKMPNGRDLLVLPSSPQTQASLIVRKPGSKNIYYLFTVDPYNSQATSGLYYSVIDLSLENGLGDVTLRAAKLMNKTTQKLGAVFHANQRDVWVMAHEYNTNKYSAFLVSKDGISAPVISAIGGTSSDIIVSMKFSPDGKQMATPFESAGGGINIFDFNNTTGSLSNTRTITKYRGVFSYSSDGHYLYTGGNGIVQVDATLPTAEQITASGVVVRSWNYNSPWEWQLGTDGKIYVTKGGGGGGTAHLGVIHYPNKKGMACEVVENQIYLEGHSSFVTYMPRFIESYFFKPEIQVTGTCLGDSTRFSLSNESYVDSIRWSFGDQAGSRLLRPAHRYAASNTYAVECTVYYGKRAEKLSVAQPIHVRPVFSLGSDQIVCKGFALKPDHAANRYLWSTGDTIASIVPAVSGKYWLQATNKFNCTGRDTVNLVVNPAPMIKFGSDTLICNNSNYVLRSKIDNPGSTLLWSNGNAGHALTITSPGLYWLEARNAHGCTSRDSIFFAFKLAPIVNLGKDTTLYRDGYLTLDAGDFGNATTYLWENGWTGRTRQVWAKLLYIGNNTLSVRVKVANGCVGYDEIGIDVLSVTDIEDAPEQSLMVYPIPAQTSLNIVMEKEGAKRAEAISMTGQKLFSIPFSDKSLAIDVSSLPAGIYILTIHSQDGPLRRMTFQKVN